MRLGLREKTLLFLLVSAALIGGLTFFTVSSALDNIKRDLTGYAAQRFVQYHREKTLGGIQADLALAKKMADTEVLRRWMASPQDAAVAGAAVAELKSLIRLFSTRQAFVASNTTGNYYQLDDKALAADPLSIKPVNRLSKDDKDDAWFFSTLAQKEPYNLNVDHNDKLNVTNLWINVVVKEDGAPIGVVGTGIDISRFIDEFVNTHEKGVTGIFFDAKGAIQGHADATRIAQNVATAELKSETAVWSLLPDAADQQGLRAAMTLLEKEPDATPLVALTMNGQRRVAGLAYLAPLKWYSLAVLDHDAVADAVHLTPVMLLLALSLGVAALAAFVFSSRYIVMPLRRVAAATGQVAAGDYQVRLAEDRQDEIGDVALAFNRMTATLVDTQRLVKANISEISAALQRCQSFAELAKEFFSRMAPLVHLGQGSLYRVEGSASRLLLCGAYGCSSETGPAEVIEFGAGLLGQCAVDRRALVVDEPPHDYLRVTSALAAQPPAAILIHPLVRSDQLLGMLELATLIPPDKAATEAIASLLPTLTLCLEIIQRDQHMQEMLRAMQQQARELAADISQRERMEAALKQSEAQLKEILENSPAGVCIVNEDGRPEFVSRRFSELLGLGQEQLLTLNISSFWRNPAERAPFLEALRAHGKVIDYPVEFITAEGKPLLVLLSSMLIPIGARRQIVSWIYDISEWQQAKADSP